jgi:hypothetical protein
MKSQKKIVAAVRDAVEEVRKSVAAGTARGFHTKRKVKLALFIAYDNPSLGLDLPLLRMRYVWEDFLRYKWYANRPRKNNGEVEIELEGHRRRIAAQCEEVSRLAGAETLVAR